jgi:hypothetical protein
MRASEELFANPHIARSRELLECASQRISDASDRRATEKRGFWLSNCCYSKASIAARASRIAPSHPARLSSTGPRCEPRDTTRDLVITRTVDLSSSIIITTCANHCHHHPPLPTIHFCHHFSHGSSQQLWDSCGSSPQRCDRKSARSSSLTATLPSRHTSQTFLPHLSTPSTASYPIRPLWCLDFTPTATVAAQTIPQAYCFRALVTLTVE